MDSPYLSMLIAVGFNFAPRGWALCEGQLLPIAQNQALYSLLGTTFGGDGRTTFGLPDLRGRAPIGYGNGPGLGSYNLGQKFGQESVALSIGQIPNHSHSLRADNQQGTNPASNGNLSAYPAYSSNTNIGGRLNSHTLGSTGGSQAHTNLQPYTVVNWCIALQGQFPSRS